MMVFFEQNLVFLSMPKTASTAYIEALAPHASMLIRYPSRLKHITHRWFDNRLRPMLEKQQQKRLDTLSVIRHPIDWLGSWYRYRQRDTLKNTPRSTHHISFDEFVLDYIKQTPPEHADVGDQAKFLQPANKDAEITYLFQYEDQSGLVQFLENRLQVKIKPKKRHVSPQKLLTLDPETELKLRKKCHRQFEIWEQAGPHNL